MDSIGNHAGAVSDVQSQREAIMTVKVSGNAFAPDPPQRDANGVTANEFAESLFEFEYCHECHGDVEDHTFVIGPFGLWFAHCNQEHVTGCKICKE
jgi:hypothetical protein